MPLQDYGLAGYGAGRPTVDDLTDAERQFALYRGEPVRGHDLLYRGEPVTVDDLVYRGKGVPTPPDAFSQWRVPQPEAPALGLWSQAKALRLQKDDQYLSEVEEDYTAGEIDERTYRSMVSQIQASRQRLLAEKGQAEAAARQQSQRRLAEDNAAAQAMRGADLRFDADGFLDRIRTDVDPVSGQVTRFYQEQDGVWKPMPSAGGDRMAGYTPPQESAGDVPGMERGFRPEAGTPLPPGWAGKVPPTMPVPPPPDDRGLAVGPGAGEVPGGVGKGGPGPQLQQRPDGSFQMTIWNGANRTEAVFNRDPQSETGWATAGVTNFDGEGRLIDPHPPEPTNQFGLTRSQMQGFAATADELTRGMRPGPARESARGAIINKLIGGHLDLQERTAVLRDRETQAKQRERDKELVDIEKELSEPFDYARAERAAQAEARSKRPAWAGKRPSDLTDDAEYQTAVADAYDRRLTDHTARLETLQRKKDKLLGVTPSASPTQRPAAPGGSAKTPSLPPAAAALDEASKQLNTLGLPAEAVAQATQAINALKGLLAQHGGDLSGPNVPPEVKARAKQLADDIKRLVPKRPAPAPTVAEFGAGFSGF